MLQVTILMVGKTREAFIREALSFYRQRLRPFLQLTVKEVREEKEAAGLSPETVKSREGERLLAQLPPRAYAAALDSRGQEFTSEAFAAWLGTWELEARPLAFLLGGHLGLGEAVFAAAHSRLSLSRLTLPHELARLVLLEQLYRAATIRAGHPYHV